MRFSIGMAYAPPDHYLPIAKAADAAGYHAIACSDHVVNLETLTTPYPYTPDGQRRWEPFTDWLDPWVAISAMAAVTERINFFTNVYVLPMRNPFVVAKTIATAAVLSGNRVAFGIGMGWCEEEFDLMEQPFKGRGKRADEELQLLKELWEGGRDWVEHHGAAYDVPRLEMQPAPTAPVPVYVGGVSEPALNRAAKHDGWISDLCTTAELGEFWQRIDAKRTELGRSDVPFSMVGSASDAFDVEGYRKVEAVGVTDLLTMPWFFYSGFTDDLQLKIDGINRFAEDVLAHFADARPGAEPNPGGP